MLQFTLRHVARCELGTCPNAERPHSSSVSQALRRLASPIMHSTATPSRSSRALLRQEGRVQQQQQRGPRLKVAFRTETQPNLCVAAGRSPTPRSHQSLRSCAICSCRSRYRHRMSHSRPSAWSSRGWCWARPNQTASRSWRRALLTPQVNPGSLYRCGNRI